MLDKGIEPTREAYLDLAWPDRPAEWTAEHELELPEPLRDPTVLRGA
jgi:hypothetical protein